MKKLWLLASAALLITGLGACGEAEDAVDNIDAAIDCDSICDRYKDCYDSDYDTEACENNCKDKAETDNDYQNKVDQCESCIDDRACGENFSCVDECIGIVP